MANQELLEILKQGVDVWNKWRHDSDDHDAFNPDLSGANLRGINFRGANFIMTDLEAADLREADFTKAMLSFTHFDGADLSGAVLCKAMCEETIFIRADLTEADLSDASLWRADFGRADLSKANLSYANLCAANLQKALLSEVILRNTFFYDAEWAKTNPHLAAIVGGTIFRHVDLRDVIGLEDVRHLGPSGISMDTFALSKGKIPEIFLRGCGLSDWEIKYAKLYDPELSDDEIDEIFDSTHKLRAQQPQQFSRLFISYSHDDGEFVDKIGTYLTEKGIRFWRDTHEMKAGRIEAQIDRAINQNQTVLLILSENSIQSDWVEHEVRTARELEKELGHDTLCPVALDDSWKSSPWPKRVMEQVMEYNILDFSEWEDDVKFDGMFRRLIDGLELFYKG